MTLNRKLSTMSLELAIKVYFNLIYGGNLAQAAAKAHVSKLNWKRKGLFAEKKSSKRADGHIGSTPKGCLHP
jgi:hypothetical protein